MKTQHSHTTHSVGTVIGGIVITVAKRSSHIRVCASVLLALMLTSAMLCAQAANWYVRPGGTTYGSANGTSWTNAWSGLSKISWTTVACGDVIWVAGGVYAEKLAPQKKCTAAARLSIRRARSDDTGATSAAGWSSTFDSTINQSGSQAEIQFNGDYDYVTISGRTKAGGGTYGWFLDRSGTGAGGGNGISFNSSSSDFNTIEYMDLRGPGKITLNSDARGIDCTPPSGSVTGNVFSHMKLWDWESAAYAVSCSSPIFEYIEMYDIAPQNTATFHPNGIITWGSPNGIVRYSKFHKGPNGLGVGEGIFFEQSGGSTAWQIYGNVFYDLDYSGLKAIEISSAVGAIKVFNNTFVNVLVGTLYMSDSPSCSGGEWRNNLGYLASANTCGTASANITATSSTVFAGYANKDFHIVSTVGTNFPKDKGTTLSSYFTVDMDGTAFGADGSWDVGAYASNSGTPTPPLTAPTNLRGQ